MADETNEERQINELGALQAIYGDAVEEYRTGVWNVWMPLEILLTLTPLHDSNAPGVHCSVTLHIRCCHNYPDKPPSISIHKVQGLSIENSNRLLKELDKMASGLCGEVMIFQLAQHTQQFLCDHNKPILSFYEEMLQQKNETEKLKQQNLEEKEKEERQKIKDEVQKRQEILKAAGKQRVYRTSVSQETNNTQDEKGDAPELVYYADSQMSPAKKHSRVSSIEVPCTCSNKGAQVLRVTQWNNKKVYIGNCLGHSSNGSTTYLAINDDTGERIIAKKWVITPSSDYQIRNRQDNNLQLDLKAICRLKHPNLVPYVALETSKETVKRTTKQHIYIFRDFFMGNSVKVVRNKFYSDNDKYAALKLVRHVGLGVLSALKELHSVNVVHRDVRCENVFLDDSGEVKLVGVALDSRLAEMFERDSYCDRQTEAQDIYATALLLLSLISPSMAAYEAVPHDLPASAKDFFSKCLTEDEHSQWSAEQLVGHAFLIDNLAAAPPGKADDGAGSGSEDDDAVKKIHQVSPSVDGHSRLNAEFEVLTWLGKGGFGDVLKVKNKLDGGFYAIKRVQLNPENVQLNKKITREVKLLSRLNHENVVRYYNAWIESIIDNEELEDTSTIKSPEEGKRKNSLEEVVAKLGQEVKVEWSISEGVAQKMSSQSDSEDDDDEPDPWFNIMKPEDESSSGIEFEEDLENQSKTIPSELDATSPRPKSIKLKQVLYIQMEFCEKHTLRQAIDGGLYQENFRAWRLFREVVEGLAHVHQRGMIHRDLKPVNIFLDSSDHVKIGDFGLATKAFSTLPVDDKNKPQEEIEGSLTGQVGTALYVAPELLQSSSKVIYNQKVDIYSLGIILFEMFHPPLSTGMERMKVLTDLRGPDITMPPQFITEENQKQIHVIRWLLSHSPSSRPTCAELLASSAVPRAVSEGALSGLLAHTLSERGCRGYPRLLQACMDQRVSPAEDLTYQSEMKSKPTEMLAAVKDTVVRIFRSHGAVEFSPPLLTPRAKCWDQHPNAVKVMTSSGCVCHLPHDLRLPFARHIAYNGITHFRRYTVDRVYRERHVSGFHPREILECAFDVVTPYTDSLWSDAEVLVACVRAATECGLKVSVQLNHTELLRTLLLSCGVSADKHHDLYCVLQDVCSGRITSLQLQTHLTSLCVSKRDEANLLRLLDSDVPVNNVREVTTALVKNSKRVKVVSQAIRELETVYKNAVAFGCECQISVWPFLAYGVTLHRGVFWQVSVVRNAEQKSSKHRASDLIAVGGRYDALVEEFWKIARKEKDHDSSELKCSSVGFSMSLERIAAILKKMHPDIPPAIKNFQSPLFCVCIKQDSRVASLARAAWGAGGACAVCAAAEADARELTGAAVLLLGDDVCVRAVHWTDDRVREYKLAYTEVQDFIKQKLNPENVRSSEGAQNKSISWNENNDKSNTPNISVSFVTGSDKITKNSKRHCENQINTQLTSILTSLGAQPSAQRMRVNAVAVPCEAACVRYLCAQLTAPLQKEDVKRAFRNTADMFMKRHHLLDDAQAELTNLMSSQNRSTDEIQLFALYSIPDSLCRLIT